METFFDQIRTAFTLYLPNLLLALGVLILGWILAYAIAGLVRNLLNRTTLDDRIARMVGNDPNAHPENIRVESWISTIIFWLIMLFTIVAFFQILNLSAVSVPLRNFLDQVIAFIPGLLGALVLLVVAWLVATILRAIIVRVLNASGFVRRFSEGADMRPQDRISVSQTIGNVVYWLVFLLFLPAILDALNLQGLLAPVQGLVDEILSVLPNLLGAGLILVVGWLVARIIRQVVTNLLAGLGVDRIGDDTGVSGTTGRLRLSDLIGTIIYILILIPVAIAALNTLNIPAISQPASAMLTNLLNALPAIFGAFLLLGIAYVVARLAGRFVAGILSNIGFDRIFSLIGIYRAPTVLDPRTTPGTTSYEGGTASTTGEIPLGTTRLTPSQIVGYLVTVAIVLFAVMEAANLLGFGTLSLLISRFLIAAGQVLVGLVVFGLGLYLANLVERIIRDTTGERSNILAIAAKVAIIFFAAALALREMGIAESIVNLAFGLLLGAVAVAIALAFGLGGREIAGRQLERWRNQYQTSLQIPATGRDDTDIDLPDPNVPPTE